MNLIVAVVAIVMGVVFWPISAWSVLLIVVGAMLVFLVAGRSLLWRRAYRDAKKFTGDISITFSDEKIHVETAESASDLSWAFYTGYLDAPEFTLLYMTRRTFSIIPKAAFANANAQQDFMKLVERKLQPVR